MEICEAPTHRLNALNKYTHIMYIEMFLNKLDRHDTFIIKHLPLRCSIIIVVVDCAVCVVMTC